MKPDRGNPKGSAHGADFEYRFLVRPRIKRTHLLRQTTGGKAVFHVNGPDGRSCDLATDRISAAIGHRFAPHSRPIVSQPRKHGLFLRAEEKMRLYGRTLDDRFHKTDHHSTFVESDQARISQGHLTTSVPANIRFEPRKRPTRELIHHRSRAVGIATQAPATILCSRLLGTYAPGLSCRSGSYCNCAEW
jgi:hypothetical protein